MDGFVNALKRLTLSTNYSRWSPQFSRMVQQVCTRRTGALTLHERIALLRKLDPYIKQLGFTNTDDSEVLHAKEDLLMLWEHLLEFVVAMTKPPIKELGYALIVMLMQREEFTLRKLGFGPDSAGPRVSQAHLRLAQRYKALLLQTFMLVIKGMMAKGKFAEIIHFSAQTLVVFFFRLPLVGGRIVDALQSKAAAQRERALQQQQQQQQDDDDTEGIEAAGANGDGGGGNEDDDDGVYSAMSAPLSAPSSPPTKPEAFTEARSEAAGAAGAIAATASTGPTHAGASHSVTTTAAATSSTTTASTSASGGAAASTAVAAGAITAAAAAAAAEAATAATSASAAEARNVMRRTGAAQALAERQSSDFIASNPDLFQWNYLNSEQEAAALGPALMGDDNACLAWLSTKETFFLTFVEVYIVHVESVATQPVRWQVIPAYDLILECFWPLLKSAMWWDGICKRRTGDSNGWVSSLPAYMRVKRSALALLSNKSLLNHFIRLTYECTNLHSLLSVDSCVEHLNLWFSTVAYSASAREGIVNHNQNSRNTPPKQTVAEEAAAITQSTSAARPSLPDDFDFDGYWLGIRAMLDSELFQVLLKVCSLLYNTLHLFHGQLRVRFVGDLMNEFFFRLFLHWSSEVRTFFQLTLVYKVLRADRRNLPCFTDAQVIRDYGGSADANSASRPILQRRFSFGDKDGDKKKQAEQVPANVYSGESSFERRMAIFDDTNTSDNEELLLDIMFCSKIDAFVRMCLDGDDSIPVDRRVYIDASLRQYAQLLKQYYRGVTNDQVEVLPQLAHRMVYSEFADGSV
jgi:hypothetical protein